MRAILFKQFTALSGTLFLTWLLFSPVVGIWLLTRFSENVNFAALALAVLLTYLVVGTIFYGIAAHFGIVPKESLDDMMPLEDAMQITFRPGFEALKMLAIGAPVTVFVPLLRLSTLAPIAGAVVAVILMIALFTINYYPPIRSRTFQLLSFGEKNERIAIWRGRSFMQAINGLVVFICGVLLIGFSLYVAP